MTNNPGTDGISSIFSSKLMRDLITDQAVKGLRNGGVRLGENGLDKLRGLDTSDVMGVVDQILGGITQATSMEEKEPKPSPFPQNSYKPTPKPAPAPEAPKPAPAPEAPAEEVKVEISVKEPTTTDEKKKVSESLAVLEAVFTQLTPATRDTAIASVMRLVESASGNGLTGEHATWVARLYGNHQLS